LLFRVKNNIITRERNNAMIRQQILELARQGTGLITSAQLKQMGIPSVYLTRLVREKLLHRVARGVYALSPHAQDPWFTLQAQSPVCIFSYASALYLHHATDIIPARPEVTVYSGYNASHLGDAARVHYVKRSIHPLGEVTVTTQFGNPVCCYDMERIVCDLIANRHKVDAELFVTTLQRYAQSPAMNSHKLMQYAGIMGISSKVQQTMEILV
jgi:predicted transcriptional regulator of viral defense system